MLIFCADDGRWVDPKCLPFKVLQDAGQAVPEGMYSFGPLVTKKKTSSLYGDHFKEVAAEGVRGCWLPIVGCCRLSLNPGVYIAGGYDQERHQNHLRLSLS